MFIFEFLTLKLVYNSFQTFAKNVVYFFYNVGGFSQKKKKKKKNGQFSFFFNFATTTHCNFKF